MFLYDDVITHGQSQPRSGSRRLRCEKRLENSFSYCVRDAVAVIADPNLDVIAMIPGTGGHRWRKAVAQAPLFFVCRVTRIVRDVQEYATEIMRDNLYRLN